MEVLFISLGNKIQVKNSNYILNRVKYSGGVFFISRESSDNFLFSENNFVQNIAQEAGGVFFCDKEGSQSCRCSNCVFKLNTASSYGDRYASDISRLDRISNGNIDLS